MIRAYDDYGNVVDMVEHDAKVRADAIEEFKKRLLANDVVRRVAEQLKEKNETEKSTS